MATMPGKPTLVGRVTPRIRSRLGEVPGTVPLASVVICVSKFAVVSVTAPPSLTLLQPKLLGSATVRAARMVPSARTRSASVQPPAWWNVIVPLDQLASPGDVGGVGEPFPASLGVIS